MASAEQQIRNWLKDVDQAVKGYEKKDKRKILKKGAEPVWLSAVNLTPKRTASKNRPELNPRYRSVGKRGKRARKGEGRPVSYYAIGNLQDSISIMSFRRSDNVFVGPWYLALGKSKPTVIGRRKDRGDGYYAQMVYGSAAKFGTRVLVPALRMNASKVRKIVLTSVKDSIIKRSGKQ